MRVSQFILILMVPILAVSCDATVSKEEEGVFTVALPAGPPLPGSRDLPTLDEVFSEAEPGAMLRIVLEFSMSGHGLGYPIAAKRVEVEKGSVTFRGSEGYVTFLPEDQVICKPSEELEELHLQFETGREYLGVSYFAGNEEVDPVSNLIIAVNTELVDEDGEPADLEYRVTHLPLDETAEHAVRLDVEFSEDFRGIIDGWFVWTPS